MLRVNQKHSLSVDKLATSTRTPNRYDVDSLKSKTISQDLELEANRLKGQAITGVRNEFLTDDDTIAPLNLNRLIENVDKNFKHTEPLTTTAVGKPNDI